MNKKAQHFQQPGWHCLFMLLCLNTAVLVPTCFGKFVASQEEAEQQLNRARAAYRQHDYVTVKREAAAALNQKPGLAEAHLLLALVHWQEKDNNRALQQASKAIQLQPVYPAAHYLMTRLYFQARNYERAYASINEALQQGLASADAYVLLGDIALGRQHLIEAKQAYTQALQQTPPNNELTPAFHLRLQAISNTLEIDQQRDSSDFVGPKLVKAPKVQGTSVLATFIWGGVVNEQGSFQDGLLLTVGAHRQPLDGSFNMTVGKLLKLNPKDLKFTPAKKNGVPVSVWVYVTYMQDSVFLK